MARIDDYINARKIAVESLGGRSLDSILEETGFHALGNKGIEVPFLDGAFHVSYPDFIFSDPADPQREIKLQEQVLLLHYLGASNIPMPTGMKVAYRELKDASFYFGPFTQRAIEPLKKVFGDRPEAFSKTAPLLGGTPIEDGDLGFTFTPLPRVPLHLILWRGDDEFPAEAGVLFDATVEKILSAEDTAWLAGMVIYRLIALSYR